VAFCFDYSICFIFNCIGMNISQTWKDKYKSIHKKAYTLSMVKRRPSEWVESTIILPDGVSRYKGKFSYNISPYAREIVDRIASDDPTRVVSIMKCAQIGLTQGLIIPGMAYVISEDAYPMLFMAGDKDLAKTSIRERFDPIIQSSGLQGLIRPSVIRAKNQRTGDTDFSKEYAGGRLTVEGTNNVTKMRQISVKFIFADDWEAAPRNDKNEGSLRKLMEGRQTSYGNMAKTFFISTPTIKQTSNIEPVYLLGDQRKWHWKCPHCNNWINLQWRIEKEDGTYAGIVYEVDKNGQLINSSVKYKCQECGELIPETMKYNLNLKGKWIPTAKPQIENYCSYHLNALVIPPGFVTWVDLAKEWLEACPPGQPVKKGMLQTFLNIRMGETWEEQGESPKVLELMQNTRDYEVGVVPDKTCEELGTGKIVLLTLSCDLNGIMERDNEDARLDWEIKAHTSGGQSYSVEHGSIGTFKRVRDLTYQERISDSERQKYTYHLNQYNSVWNELEKIMRAGYIGESKSVYTIGLTLIDTGFFTQSAKKFIDSIDDLLVYGIKGKAEAEFRRITKDTPFFSRSREAKNLYLLEVNQIKDIVAENMKLREGNDGSQPEGFMNFPQPKAGKYTLKNYFSHFEGERRVEVIKNDEVVGFAWEKKHSNSQNHFWDVHIYNTAARDIYIDLLKQSDPNLKNLTWASFCELVLG
jgi:phage terminase large subunit GpA-like protein